jgi:hypothetical protein
MSVSQELLSKVAKVYEAAESVEGMKPKMQYEEHKDLTPDEFSREHTNKAEEKSSAFAYDNKPFDDYDALRSGYGLPKVYGLAGAGLGALTGGLYGASTAKKGKRTGAILRGLLGGALTGGAGGLGAGFAVRHVLPEANRPGVVHDLKNMGRLLQGTSPEEMIDKQYLDTFGKSKKDLESTVGGAALLGGGAGLLGGGLLAGAMMPEEKDDNEDTKKSAAFAYGVRAAHAILPVKALAEKQAGPVSEYLSSFNPLNWYGGSLAGGGIALATPTRSLKEQAEFDSNDSPLRALTNVLVPGVGPYRGFKRIGAAIRSPEMKAIKTQRTQDKAKRELAALEQASGGKEAGWKTEALGSFVNPINLLGGNYLGALAAGTTPTRTLNEQSAADDSTWSNIFVPGQAQYNYFKRIGAATRSPEMKAMRSKAKMDRLRQQAGTDSKPEAEEEEVTAPEPVRKAASLYAFGAKNKAEEKAAATEQGFLNESMMRDISRTMLPISAATAGGRLGGLAGLIGGGLHGMYDPGSYAGLDEDGNPALKRRSRLMGALRGGLGYGLGGLVAGGALGGMAGETYADYKYGNKPMGAPATPPKTAAFTYGSRAAHAILPTMERAFRKQ